MRWHRCPRACASTLPRLERGFKLAHNVIVDFQQQAEPIPLVRQLSLARPQLLLRELAFGDVRDNASLHIQAEAIDIRLPGVPTAVLRDAALNLHRGGVGYYRASDFVHVDVGRVRRR